MLKKKSTKFRIIDLAIILVCSAGALASGLAFWGQYNRTLVKMNEEPIGTIIFKKNTAQRKFNDRDVWDRLKQATPIYNGDTIRTIEQSEAVIIFSDQTTNLNLDEGTLLQIFFDERQGSRIDFSGGNLEVVSGAKGVTISSGGYEIKLEGQASLTKSEEGFGLSVLEGQANFDGKEIGAGSILALDSDGKIDTSPVIAITSFGPSARVLGAPGELVPVVFSWNTSNFDSGSHVIVEVATDRSFNYIAAARDVKDDTSVSIPLKSGKYWWRAYPANAGSGEPANRLFPSGNMEVIPVTATTLLSPARAAEFIYSDKSQIPLSWSAGDSVSAYLVEISAQADMSVPVVSRQVERNSVTQTGLESGHWYWRITPVFPAWYIGSAASSAVSDFSVVQGKVELADPVLTFPVHNGTIYMDSSGKRLLWAYDPNAASWDVELADNAAMENPVVKENVTSNYYSLPPQLIQDGKIWYWRISALGGASPAVSAIRNFTVSAGNQPTAVPVVSAAAPPAEASPPSVPEPPPVVEETPPKAPEPPEEHIIQDLQPPVRVEPAKEPVVQTPPPELVQPEPAVQTPPAGPPEPEPEPPVQAQQQRPAAPAQPVGRAALFRLAPSRSISAIAPAVGYTFTVEQLAGAESIDFSWKGTLPEYQFALYQIDGAEVIPASVVTVPSYILLNPGMLTEGEYVWHVYEKDRRGNWGLPSIANHFAVISGNNEDLKNADN